MYRRHYRAPPTFSPSAPNQTTIGICRTDSQTGILGAGYSGKTFYWSAEMYRIFGIDNPHISDKKNLIREQVFEEDFPIYKEKIAELLKQRHPVEGQVRVRRRDNTIAYCLFKAGLIYDKPENASPEHSRTLRL